MEEETALHNPIMPTVVRPPKHAAPEANQNNPLTQNMVEYLSDTLWRGEEMYYYYYHTLL